MHIRLVNVYLLNVPSVSSPYFNKIKLTSHLGKWHALSLEFFHYNRSELEIANAYKYLGLYLARSGSFNQAKKHIAEQAN